MFRCFQHTFGNIKNNKLEKMYNMEKETRRVFVKKMGRIHHMYVIVIQVRNRELSIEFLLERTKGSRG